MTALIRQHYFTLARMGLALALIIITVLSLLPVSDLPLTDWNDKAQHLLAFFTLAFLVDASFPDTSFDWRKGGLLMSYGILIECLQWLTGYRFFSVADMLADLAGILAYLLLTPMLRKIPLINWRWHLVIEASSDRAG